MKLKKGDLIVILIFILALCGFLANYLLLKHPDEKIVAVEIDGKLYAEYTIDGLNKAIEKKIPLKYGKSFTLVLDHDGAYVKNVDCPDHICEKTGKITAPGKTIVCLPNKFVVYIENKRDQTRPMVDGVAS